LHTERKGRERIEAEKENGFDPYNQPLPYIFKSAGVGLLATGLALTLLSSYQVFFRYMYQILRLRSE
jgi:hypothetical protein